MAVGTAVSVAVAVGIEVAVAVAVGTEVAVAVAVGIEVAVAVAVGTEVAVAVAVAVAVDVPAQAVWIRGCVLPIGSSVDGFNTVRKAWLDTGSMVLLFD